MSKYLAIAIRTWTVENFISRPIYRNYNTANGVGTRWVRPKLWVSCRMWWESVEGEEFLRGGGNNLVKKNWVHWLRIVVPSFRAPA